MNRTSIDETYLSAFNAAVAQREQIYAEAERLKSRRALLEAAAMALEPVIYPDEYMSVDPNPDSPAVIEIGRPAPSPEIWNPTVPVEITTASSIQEEPQEKRPVQAVTQIYVRGEGEPDEEIQRRISIAIGRSAAD